MTPGGMGSSLFKDRNTEAQELQFQVTLWTKWTLLLLETATNLGLKKDLKCILEMWEKKFYQGRLWVKLEWRWKLRKVSRRLKLVFVLGTCVKPGEIENRFYMSWEQGVRGHSSGPARDEKCVLKSGTQEGTPSCKKGLEIRAPLLRLRGKVSVLDCGAV